MKILFCTNKFEEISNGPAKFANLILEINERYPEHEVRILTEDVRVPSEMVYRLELRYPRLLALFSHLFRMRQYHRKALEIQKTDFVFDVLVYNNAFIGLWSALSGLRTVGMINDYNNASKNWGGFHFEYTFIKQFLFKQLERWSVKAHKKIITNSDYLTEYLKKVYPPISGKVYRLYKAIEKPEYIKSNYNINIHSEIKILFVKSDYRIGGLEDLIAALGELPNYCFLLSVVGPPETAFLEIMEWAKTYSNLKLNLLGVQTQVNVFRLLIENDIFCVPSRQEGLGVANLEALARGIPVISTNVGGVPEVLADGQCGWLVNPRNPKSLAVAIKECVENNHLRKIKVRTGLEKINNFSVENALNKFIYIISE